MYLFPLIGLIIGLAIGILSFLLFSVVEGFLLGFLITATIVGITGLHHSDALSDLADGSQNWYSGNGRFNFLYYWNDNFSFIYRPKS